MLTAIDAGYRSIDTAQGYDNEAGVGRAVERASVPRDELFITSKLRTRDQGYDATFTSFMGTLDRLGLDYLDLFLIHWPVPKHDRYSDTWKALVQLQTRWPHPRPSGCRTSCPSIWSGSSATAALPLPSTRSRCIPDISSATCAPSTIGTTSAIESYSPLGGGKGLRR